MTAMDRIRTVQPGTGGMDDAFLNRWLGILGSRMIPYQWRMINDDEKSSIIHDFRVAAGDIEGGHIGFVFQDEGLFKWLESAAYYVADHPEAADIRAWRTICAMSFFRTARTGSWCRDTRASSSAW